MSNRTKSVSGGLFVRHGAEPIPVPLAGATVDAEIDSFCAKVVVSHRYVNSERTPIEAVYVFPLDEASAVCGFEAIVDGTLVVGEVHPREKAFEIYDDAIEAGHGGFLLDEERPDVFQASIGNLLPGKEVLVRITYVTELAVDDSRLRFMIPTTVSPRYAPAPDRRGVGRSDAETLNPPLAWSVPYGVNLSVRLRMPGAITSVESPSHPVSLRLDGTAATVTLAQQDAAMDRDFLLVIGADGLETPHATSERTDEGHAIAVAFAPHFAAVSAPAEVIFLIDRSGSMEGDSIAEVRNALQLCLRSLTAGCRFNIVGFGSSFEMLFSVSRPYDQASLEDATRHVESLDANLGGTEILDPLAHVLSQRALAGLPRQIVVLTDGQVTNTDAVLALASKHASSARIFTFGIGAGASAHLVRGLARAGGGTAEFIAPGERIEPKVVRQVGRLLSPAVTDVTIEWTDADVVQVPATLPPVFTGGRLLAYAWARSGSPSAATLRAQTPSGPVAFSVTIPAENDATAGKPAAVSVLAARARIRELEESPAWLTGRGSQQSGRREARATSEIVRLACAYGLVSRETSYVAIERRENAVPGEVQLRRVPVALTRGWGGVDRLSGHVGSRSVPPQMRLTVDMPAMLMADDNEAGPDVMALPAPRASRSRLFKRLDVGYRTPSRFDGLVKLQNADGSWAFSRELTTLLGVDRDRILSNLGGPGQLDETTLRAWATALALAWLHENAYDSIAQWQFLAAKADAWLRATPVQPPDGSNWIDAARELLRA